MKYLVAELDGALLDAAVAKAEGLPFEIGTWDYNKALAICYVRTPDRQDEKYGPSRWWDDGGPIIERERISLDAYPDSDPAMPWKGWIGRDHYNAPTPLIAAMRAYVASKFGETIELDGQEVPHART